MFVSVEHSILPLCVNYPGMCLIHIRIVKIMINVSCMEIPYFSLFSLVSSVVIENSVTPPPLLISDCFI
jgi:hypothetical protein